MSPSPLPSQETIVTVLTGSGRAAVASLAVEGAGAVPCVARFFHALGGRPLEQTPLDRIVYGQWRMEPEDSQSPSEGVVVCRTAPERVEIHCHGGKAAVAALVAALTSAGCRHNDWRTWVQSAATDLLAAEAHIALAEARTQRAAAILLDQYRGALRRAIEAILDSLASHRADHATRGLEELLQYAGLGLHLTQPWRVVLAGRPNVGKSSLINALVGYRRSIVHDTPGVTRDVVTAPTALEGWPVELADTAGLRTSPDPVESAGVARTQDVLQTAAVVVLVFDAAQRWTADDAQLRAAAPGAILVHNKSDLPAQSLDNRPAGIAVSAVTGAGLEELKQAIVARLAPQTPPPGAAVPFTRRQVETLKSAQRLIGSHQLDAAAEQLSALFA